VYLGLYCVGAHRSIPASGKHPAHHASRCSGLRPRHQRPLPVGAPQAEPTVLAPLKAAYDFAQNLRLVVLR